MKFHFYLSESSKENDYSFDTSGYPADDIGLNYYIPGCITVPSFWTHWVQKEFLYLQYWY